MTCSSCQTNDEINFLKKLSIFFCRFQHLCSKYGLWNNSSGRSNSKAFCYDNVQKLNRACDFAVRSYEGRYLAYTGELLIVFFLETTHIMWESVLLHPKNRGTIRKTTLLLKTSRMWLLKLYVLRFDPIGRHSLCDFNALYCLIQWICTVKSVLSGHSKIDKTKILT